MMEVGSSVLAEHPQFGRSLLPAPAVSCCSRAGVSITGLCWTSAAGLLSPAFFMHHQAARESQKHRPSKAFDQSSTYAREGAGGICAAATL